MDKNLQDFIAGYIDCALWVEIDNDNRSIGTVAELSSDAQLNMEDDATEFYQFNKGQLMEAACHREWSSLGHDFWLTRNGHGSGFWDCGFPGTLGETLSTASHNVGERDLYIGDDGLIYQS